MLRHSAVLLSPLTLALLLHGLPAQAEDAPVGGEASPAAVVSEPAARPVPPRPMLDTRSESHEQALQRKLPARQQFTLDGGADPFLSLWLPANQAQPVGLVILLPGEGETADWPTAIGPLRRQLPDIGWSTLSLTLPDGPNAGVKPRKGEPVTVVLEGVEKVEAPEATETSEAQVEPTAEAASAEQEATPSTAATEAIPEVISAIVPLDDLAPAEPDHAQRVQARLRAALEFARQQKPRTIVLLGHGTGAYWAARFLQEQQPNEVAQLVIVSPREPEGAEAGLDELLPQLHLATADFYYRDQTSQQAAARERLNAGKRQQHPTYMQIGLQSLPSNARAEQEQLVRRVRGWLELGARSAQR
jgi:hypothetical protein